MTTPMSKSQLDRYREQALFGDNFWSWDAEELVDEIDRLRATEAWQPISTAPWDEFVLLLVPSGYKRPEWDYVQCIRHSDGYHNRKWTTAQNDHLTDSHTGEVAYWRPMLELPIMEQET